MGRQASNVVNNSRGDDSDAGFKPGPQFSEELRDKVASEYRALEGKDKEIPVTLNNEVKAGIEYFLTDARRFMIRSIGRSHKYVPMMQKILRKNDLPPDLAYLVLIESGYRVDAISPAGAGGLWQFIPATGRRYGLKINDWVDERMHPEKATHAAAGYLKDLYGMFNSWNLAAAGYNCGEGKVIRCMKKYKVKDFWELAELETCLRDETKQYVPKFLAAMIIAKDPKSYGLTGIEPQKPDEFDEVMIPTATDLNLIAKLAGTKESVIRDLNPYLKLWATPLNELNYTVRVPKGSGHKFRAAYAKVNPRKRLKTSVHTVQSNESLKTIAKVYKLSPSTLKTYNKLNSNRLKKGQKIKLPVDPVVYNARQKEYQSRMAAERRKLEKIGNRMVYTVRSGDNPWLIAKRFDIHWKDIAVWNDIADVKKIMPGDELVLFLGPGPKVSQSSKKTAAKKKDSKKTAKAETSSKKTAAKAEVERPQFYKVQNGDTLWKISLRFKVKPEKISELNGLKGNRIKPGQMLKISAAASAPAASSNSKKTAAKKVKVDDKEMPGLKKVSKKDLVGGKSQSYTVKKDDTLWKISQKYKISTEKIRAANGMSGNALKPGQVLKIPSGAAAVASASSSTKTAKKDKPAKKKSSHVSYKVQNGDTLWKIAQRFKVKPSEIRSWNEMKDNKIKPGDILTIKKGS